MQHNSFNNFFEKKKDKNSSYRNRTRDRKIKKTLLDHCASTTSFVKQNAYTYIYKVINNKNMYMYTIKIKNSGVAIATVCHHMDPPLLLVRHDRSIWQSQNLGVSHILFTPVLSLTESLLKTNSSKHLSTFTQSYHTQQIHTLI
jgi:hypothetical protein